MKNLEALYLKQFTGGSIHNITMLKKLQHLYIYFSKVKDLEGFSNLSTLKTLAIQTSASMSDFSFLAKLKQLEGLEIAGTLHKNLTISDLDFISKLDKSFINHAINSKY